MKGLILWVLLTAILATISCAFVYTLGSAAVWAGTGVFWQNFIDWPVWLKYICGFTWAAMTWLCALISVALIDA